MIDQQAWPSRPLAGSRTHTEPCQELATRGAKLAIWLNCEERKLFVYVVGRQYAGIPCAIAHPPVWKEFQRAFRRPPYGDEMVSTIHVEPEVRTYGIALRASKKQTPNLLIVPFTLLPKQ